MKTVWIQDWEESERGWGVRPDGCCVYLTKESAEKGTKEFLSRQEHYYKSRGVLGVPDEYSRPAGLPFTAEVLDEQYEWSKNTKV